jgi:hypothetical protein
MSVAKTLHGTDGAYCQRARDQYVLLISKARQALLDSLGQMGPTPMPSCYCFWATKHVKEHVAQAIISIGKATQLLDEHGFA